VGAAIALAIFFLLGIGGVWAAWLNDPDALGAVTLPVVLGPAVLYAVVLVLLTAWARWLARSSS
jgi:hypothetical protein